MCIFSTSRFLYCLPFFIVTARLSEQHGGMHENQFLVLVVWLFGFRAVTKVIVSQVV